MLGRHRTILDELKYITHHDGFVETCLELRDSMLFYERSLVIAGCSNSIEVLMSLAMLWACLDSDEEAEEVFQTVEMLLENLPERLNDPESPIDVQALVSSFLQTAGWVLSKRLPVLKALFRCYMYNDYDRFANIDEVLQQALTSLIDNRHEDAVYYYAQAGAMALRGRHIRPVWLIISPPLGQVWLKGIINIINNFRNAPTFSFPFDSVDAERRKWRSGSAGVIDLKAFRSYRYPMSSFDDVVSEPGDKIDEVMELVFGLDLEQVIRTDELTEVREDLKPLLLSVLQAPHLRQETGPEGGCASCHAARLVADLKIEEAIEHLIEIVDKARPNTLVFSEAIAALRKFGQAAVKDIVSYVRTTDNLPAAAAIAQLLGNSEPSEEVFKVLIELYERTDWCHHRDLVASALADYGDLRAIPVLQKGLNGSGEASREQKEELTWALRELRRKGTENTADEDEAFPCCGEAGEGS